MALSGPAAPGDFPDPFVARVDGGWAAFATNAGGCNVQVRFSADLTSWADQPDALPAVASWAVPGWTWSPAVTGGPEGWVLWYAVREPQSGRQAISVATAAAWAGPYVDDSGAPAVFQLDQGGSIDPSVFRDADGTRYLVWKADSNALDRPSSLWGASLAPDGRSLAGPPVLLLDQDRPWEAPLIEAPSLFAAAGRYWLAYSAGWWESPGYAMGLASGDAPLGPFTKLTTAAPWVETDGVAAGPGGQEVFADGAGGLRIAYHAWDPGRVGYAGGGARSLRLGRLELGAVGTAPSLAAQAEAGWRRGLTRLGLLHDGPASPLPSVGP